MDPLVVPRTPIPLQPASRPQHDVPSDKPQQPVSLPPSPPPPFLSEHYVPVQDYSKLYIAAVAVIVAFGGLLAPVAEVKLGLGGVPWLVISG